MMSWGVFAAVIVALASYYFPEMLRTPNETRRIESNYDFIIVGAGSAGSVLARRLAEISRWRILLLEAGGDETPESKIPLMTFRLFRTQLDWNYTTVKQKLACLNVDGFCEYPRGHVMGGSSSTNAMFYVRGNKQDYDEWEQDGATGWSYKDVLPYFLKSENIRSAELYDSPYHWRGGLLSVQYSIFKSNITDDLIKAGEEFGLPNRDFNGQSQTGINRAQLTVHGPLRCSTSTGFLLNKPNNLSIIKNAKVIQLIIDSRNKIVRGVLYRKNGVLRRVMTSYEVILSAGAINSPQLLMLSGIGPKQHLKDLNIPLVADLPVGQNLQDHFFIPLPFRLRNYKNLNSFYYMTPENCLEFTQNKSGPFTTNGAHVIGFLNVSGNLLEEPPNVQYHFTEALAFPPEVASVSTTVTRPKSLGTVRLNSNDPDDAPLIDPNFFSVQEDLDIAVAGLNHSINLMTSNAMKLFSPRIDQQSLPLCSNLKSDLKAYLTCIATHYSRTIYHPVGTCKMGSVGSPSTVVDNQLNVLGVRRLRVVDASVMPFITRGNTNAPVIMIAEKAADIIKRAYRR